MTEAEKKVLEDANKVLEMAKNRIFSDQVAKQISHSIIVALTPVLTEMNKTTKEAVSQYVEEIRKIKLEPPVNLPAPKVNVTTPKAEVEVKIPEIKIPEIKFSTQKIEEAITKAFSKIKISAPKVEVQEREFPGEIEVKGIAEYFKTLGKAFTGKLNVGLEEIDRDNPLHMVLVDKKGNYYTPAGGGAMPGGKGGSKLYQDIPLGYEQLEVDTVVGFASIPDKATKVIMTVDDANLRYRDDGGNPTADVGLKVFRGGTIILNSRKAITQFRAIKAGTSSSELNILYYQVK